MDTFLFLSLLKLLQMLPTHVHIVYLLNRSHVNFMINVNQTLRPQHSRVIPYKTQAVYFRLSRILNIVYHHVSAIRREHGFFTLCYTKSSLRPTAQSSVHFTSFAPIMILDFKLCEIITLKPRRTPFGVLKMSKYHCVL